MITRKRLRPDRKSKRKGGANNNISKKTNTKKENVPKITSEKLKELKSAILEDNLEAFKEIMDTYRLDVYKDYLDNYYYSIFIYVIVQAVNNNKKDILNYSLQKYGKIPYDIKNVYTTFFKKLNKYPEMYKFALDNYMYKSDILQLLLFNSIDENNFEIFKLLLKEGANVNDNTKYYSDYNRYSMSIPILLINNRNKKIITYCITNNLFSDNNIEFIIKHLENINETYLTALLFDKVMIKKDSKLNNVIDYFVVNNMKDELAKALELGYNPDGEPIEKGKIKHYPLFTAVEKGNVEIVIILLKYGANPNIKDIYGKSSILEYTIILLPNNVNPETREKYNSYIEIIKLLLENGANPNKEPEYIIPPKKPYPKNMLFISKLTSIISLLDTVNNKTVYDLLKKYGAKDTIGIKLSFIHKYPSIEYKEHEILDLSNRGLTKIPNDILNKKYKALILSHNNLSDISLLKLYNMGVKYLDLSYNPKLTELNIDLKGLKILNISYSPIEYIQELPNSLEVLAAFNCNIKDIGKFPAVDMNNSNIIYPEIILNGNPCPIGFINGYGSISRYSNKRIHRTINFGNEMINTTILPKGTILFRGSNKKLLNDDFKGLTMDSKHHLYPYYNVFFYPYPYAVDKIFKFEYMYIYVLTHDVEIVLGVEPSTNVRTDRFGKDNSYLTTCSEIKISNNPKIQGHEYDPCFTGSFIQEYPNVVGMMVMAEQDTMVHIDTVFNERFFTKYRSNFIDNVTNVGVPEIILYPLTSKSIKELVVKPYMTNKLSNNERSAFFVNNTLNKNRLNSIFNDKAQKPLDNRRLLETNHKKTIHNNNNYSSHNNYNNYNYNTWSGGVDSNTNSNTNFNNNYKFKKIPILNNNSNDNSTYISNSNSNNSYVLHKNHIAKYSPAYNEEENNEEENNTKNRNFLKREDFNYALFDVVKHTSGFEYDDLWMFLEAGFSPLGSELIYSLSNNYNPKTSLYGSLQNYHLTIDMATKMFVVYELCEPEIQARCIPIEEPYKLRYLNNNYGI